MNYERVVIAYDVNVVEAMLVVSFKSLNIQLLVREMLLTRSKARE